MNDSTSCLRRSLLLWEFLRIPFTITFMVVSCFSSFIHFNMPASSFFRVSASFFGSDWVSFLITALFFSFIASLFFNGLPILDCLLHVFCGFSLNHVRYPICLIAAVLLGCLWALILPFGWFFLFGTIYRG